MSFPVDITKSATSSAASRFGIFSALSADGSWPSGPTPASSYRSLTSAGPTTATFNGTAHESADLGVVEIVAIVTAAAAVSLITIIGNALVLIAFRLDKQLQTVSNYFLLSLAVADFAIGLVSMPLYTMYLVMDSWPLGALVCDLWLSLDYTLSNASVIHLLIISVDRYLSVTRPLTYMAKRTVRRATIIIALAWALSFLLWTPWIFLWPHIESSGIRTVPQTECYIQFLYSSKAAAIITSIVSFYLPLTVMAVLYFKIYCISRQRFGSSKRKPTATSVSAPAAKLPELGRLTDHNFNDPCQGTHQDYDGCYQTGPDCQRDMLTSTPDRRKPVETEVRGPPTSMSLSQIDDVSPLLGVSTSPSQQHVFGSSSDQRNLVIGEVVIQSNALISKAGMGFAVVPGRAPKRQDKNDSKAARTLSAILLAFVITWTPYMLFTVIQAFAGQDVIPHVLYATGYWLCYVNSTMNPLCYALCNANFRKNFSHILSCKFLKSKNGFLR